MVLVAALFLMLVGLPLAGVWLAGEPVTRYLEFPPVTRYVEHAGFSWPVFLGLAAVTGAGVAPFVWRLGRAGSPPKAAAAPSRPFPWWGWAGLAWTLAAWVLAWNRFEWFAPLQRYTFTPLWLGYIVVVNALAWRRTGHCLLRDRPRYFLALFPVSAAFWWFFEYLNRFVQNWYYVDIGEFTRLEYFLHASLSFSTVLPAVLGTRDWLASFPWLHRGLDRAWAVRPRRPRCWAGVALAAGGLGLLGIGLYPNALYALVWIAPFVVIVGVQGLRGEPTVLAPVARGDWRGVWLSALSALFCGFFWELWNYHSLAKWVYAVPYVQRFGLFEMPALGYAGYLPFGLECAAVGDWLARTMARRETRSR